MNRLFHYTTIDAAIQIVGRRKLFASYAKYLNDSSEFNFAKSFASAEVVRRTREELAHVKLAEGLELNFDGQENLVHSLTEPLEKLSPPFVACFTRPNEEYAAMNGVLSLWRGYGSRGVALVFDRDALWSQMKRERQEYSYNNIWMDDVEYIHPSGKNVPERTTELITRLTDVVPWALSQENGRGDLNYPTERVTVRPEERIDEVARLFSFAKHSSFSEEAEFRLVAAPIVKPHPKETRKRKAIEFRYSNGAVVPYIELPLGEGSESSLREILIGPSGHQERLRSSVVEFVRLSGLDVEVRASAIPYVSI